MTQSSIEKWRAERNAAAGHEPTVQESPMAAKLRARFASKQSAGQSTRQESNLLQFPVPPNAPIHNPTAVTTNEPAWRSRIKASVQSHRERQDTETVQTAKTSSAQSAAEADAAAQLLLVESALKRLRRAPVAPPAPVAARVAAQPISYPSAQSQALALMPEAERYAEAQRQRAENRQAHDEPVLELENEPLPPRRLPPAPEKLKALRTRHSTVTNLAFKIDEEPLELALEETHSAAEDFSEFASMPDFVPDDDAAKHATTADRLRAKAALHEQKLATEPSTAESLVSPWHTDQEVAEVKGQVWLGQPASIPMRVLAGICDVEAAALLYLPFFGAYYTMDGALDFDDYYIMALMVIVVMFLYQLVTFTLNGRTLGMAIFGLRNFDVEHANQRISFKRRLKQAFGGTVGLLFPPFNFVVTRVTGFQRGFGDALAGTVTLRRAQE